MRRQNSILVRPHKPDAAPDSEKLGILVHGCHLQADAWEELVWGLPPAKLGRLPHAALLAWEERAHLACVSFGTGASTLRLGAPALTSPLSEQAGGADELEGAYTLRLLWERFAGLREFTAFSEVPMDQLEVLLRNTCVTELGSQNTIQEVREGFAIHSAAGCHRICLVSSPTHLPRCLSCASVVHEQEPTLFEGSIWASPCDTSYHGYHASDVVVVEPPHRGDRDHALDELPFHEMVKRSFRIKADVKPEFLARFDALLKEFAV